MTDDLAFQEALRKITKIEEAVEAQNTQVSQLMSIMEGYNEQLKGFSKLVRGARDTATKARSLIKLLP